MSRPRPPAKLVQRDPAILPDATARGALVLQGMRTGGLLDLIEESLPLPRDRGYLANGLAAALIVFMLSKTTMGLRPFFEPMGPMLLRRLAAPAGLPCLPKSSAISRGLRVLTHDLVRPCLDKLLPAPMRGMDIFQHPAVHHLDATGRASHVIDIDPTVKAFRQRDLAEGEELPSPERRAPGSPGYTGRHRGELRIRAVPAIHDGTSLWLALRLVAVEGSLVPLVAALVDQCVHTMANFKVAAEDIIFRGDGEFGSVGIMDVFATRNARFVVRISRYTLLKREEVLKTLKGATWHPVRQGESGIPREATEVGTCWLVGSGDDRRQVQVRVVATRIPCGAEAADEDPSQGHRGVRQGGYRIELFATNLDPVGWPAPDLAELYMGRSSIENRLQQEDREFGLGRTFSMNPAGQEWVWGLGLFVWNYLVCTGWKQRPPPITVRHQERRPATAAEPTAPEASAAALEDSAPVVISEEDLSLPSGDEESASLDEPPMSTSAPAATCESPPEVPEITTAPGLETTEATVLAPTCSPLGAIVGRAFGDLDGKNGWRVDATTGLVHCPQGQRLKPCHVRFSGSGIPRLSVRTEAHACLGCSMRAVCYPEDRVDPYKMVTRTIEPDEAALCQTALKEARETAPLQPPRRKTTPPPTTAAPVPLPTGSWYTPATDAEPGPWWAERPQLVPSELRRRAHRVSPGRVVRVEAADVLPMPRPPADIAATRARRAHRRRSDAEKQSLNRRSVQERAVVTVERRQSKAM